MESLSGVLHRVNSSRNSNSPIEPRAAQWTINNLPEWLLPYVQNPMWAKRLVQLLNEGNAQILAQVVRHTKKVAKRDPVHYFARCVSRKKWTETTKEMLKKIKVDKLAAEVVKRLGAKEKHLNAIYAACWRLQGGVIRHAITAQEVGKNRFVFFCWLTSKKQGKEICATF